MKNGKYIEGNGNLTHYYKNDVLHRDNGPAFIAKNGTKKWYKNGLLHRINKPAFIWNNGNIEWYLEGQRHCETGPAKIYPGRIEEWYLFDTRYTKEDFELMVIKLNLYRKLNHTLETKPTIKKNKI